MSGHTPGPWTATRNQHGWTITGPSPRPNDSHRWLIAKTESDEPDDAADAAMIAAAPDLLQVAEGAWHLCQSLLSYRQGATDDLIRAIAHGLEAAIGKATGPPGHAPTRDDVS